MSQCGFAFNHTVVLGKMLGAARQNAGCCQIYLCCTGESNGINLSLLQQLCLCSTELWPR